MESLWGMSCVCSLSSPLSLNSISFSGSSFDFLDKILVSCQVLSWVPYPGYQSSCITGCLAFIPQVNHPRCFVLLRKTLMTSRTVLSIDVFVQEERMKYCIPVEYYVESEIEVCHVVMMCLSFFLLFSDRCSPWLVVHLHAVFAILANISFTSVSGSRSYF